VEETQTQTFEERPKKEVVARKEKEEDSIDAEDDQVAIVGYAFRFPGEVSSPERYWSVLTSSKDGNGSCLTEEISADKWSLDRYFNPNSNGEDKNHGEDGFSSSEDKGEGSGQKDNSTGRFNAKRIGQVKDAHAFDAAFFGISAEAAAAMDPQVGFESS
jgi:acyl transferase domain-containing protein